jgi:large subunit ribosomal protein L9
MEVLLRKDVDNLGEMGDVVEVADGYARNYLLPKGVAVRANARNRQQIEAARRRRAEREEEELRRVNRQAEMLDGFLCYVPARATEQGHLFGSVGARDVAEELQRSGFEGIRPSNISLDRPIEQTGDYEVEVMLHPEVRATILVRVAAEEEQDE